MRRLLPIIGILSLLLMAACAQQEQATGEEGITQDAETVTEPTVQDIESDLDTSEIENIEKDLDLLIIE